MILDNYDSFTYNLVHLVEKIIQASVDVYFNDAIDLTCASKYDKIILSPGPGIPDEAGVMKELVEALYTKKSFLGVCLGHQAIGEVLGAKLTNLSRVYHGCSTALEIVNPYSRLLRGVENGTEVGRYHSWVIDPVTLDPDFQVTAVDSNHHIMAMEHRKYNIAGVQFHPESIMTSQGEKIMRNWLFD